MQQEDANRKDGRESIAAPSTRTVIPPVTLGVFLAACILIGAFLRIDGLGVKTFWVDEAYTALRISGQGEPQLEHLADAKVHPLSDLAPYQRNLDNPPLTATIQSLARNDAHHTPLFYILERWWSQCFGSDAIQLRLLAALIGVLCIPAMFWLGYETIGALGGLIASGLFTVSPFFVTYAHQAREYSLFTFLAIVATAAYTRARTHGRIWWVLYTLTLVMGLYTDELFCFVMLSHAIPALISRTARRSLLPRVVIAFVISGIAFLPWVRNIYEYRTVIASGMDWAHKSIPITLYLEKLAFVASIPFFDLSFLDPRYGVISALVLGLVLVAGISIFRDRISLARFSYQLLMSLSLTTAGIFLVVGQLTHSFLATIGRYLTVSLLGEVLIVAWFIATNLHLRRRQMMGKSILAASLLLGIGCCLTANRSATWWDNHSDAQIPAIAEQIKQSSQALVIVEDPQLDHLLSLSHVLASNVDFAIIPFDRHAAVSLAPQPIGNAVFLLDPSPELLARIHSDGCLQATPVVAAPQSFVENVHRQVVNTPGVDSPVLWKLAPVSPHRCELN